MCKREFMSAPFGDGSRCHLLLQAQSFRYVAWLSMHGLCFYSTSNHVAYDWQRIPLTTEKSLQASFPFDTEDCSLWIHWKPSCYHKARIPAENTGESTESCTGQNLKTQKPSASWAQTLNRTQRGMMVKTVPWQFLWSSWNLTTDPVHLGWCWLTSPTFLFKKARQ